MQDNKATSASAAAWRGFMGGELIKLSFGKASLAQAAVRRVLLQHQWINSEPKSERPNPCEYGLSKKDHPIGFYLSFRLSQQIVEFPIGVLEGFYQVIQGAIEDCFVQSLSVRGYTDYPAYEVHETDQACVD